MMRVYMQDAVVDGIMSGEIPLLQTFLIQKKSKELAKFTSIVQVGLQAVVDFLQNQLFLQAAQILANLVSINLYWLSYFCLCLLKLLNLNLKY